MLSNVVMASNVHLRLGSLLEALLEVSEPSILVGSRAASLLLLSTSAISRCCFQSLVDSRLQSVEFQTAKGKKRHFQEETIARQDHHGS